MSDPNDPLFRDECIDQDISMEVDDISLDGHSNICELCEAIPKGGRTFQPLKISTTSLKAELFNSRFEQNKSVGLKFGV